MTDQEARSAATGERVTDRPGSMVGVSLERERLAAINRRPLLRRFGYARQFLVIRLGRWRLILSGPLYRPLFSERNRINCRVLALGGGWRILLRRNLDA